MSNSPVLRNTAATHMPLGFGCSNLLGDKTRAEGFRLLAAAHEAGIRHFDVARYYGYGDAESVVGEFLQTVPRNTVTVTTKFGLQPMRAAGPLKGAVAGVRRIMRSSPLVRRLVSRHAHRVVHHGRFDVASAATSLETSLRALRTDYVDVLLLHEPTVEDCTSGLLDFLSDVQDRGRIRAYGIGAAFVQTVEILAGAPQFPVVIQFDSNVLDRRVEQVRALAPPDGVTVDDRTIITHGSLAAISPLLERLRQDVRFRDAANDLLQCDAAVPGHLAGALLAGAVRANPGGLVLFRSAKAARIGDNVRAVDGRFTGEQLDRFASLCRPVGGTEPMPG